MGISYELVALFFFFFFFGNQEIASYIKSLYMQVMILDDILRKVL